ncbi:hypothetical protein RN001_010052 [Aquatica leii]|uniref:Secreted protein n=1 Tax=Aquatica leii TaxID=1421715 RepID=A0AAN7S8E5_9COLE|nr:hypothetical protein RN001_010052 [Aquatica leii]
MYFAVLFLTVAFALLVVSGGPAWKDRNVQRGSGLKVGGNTTKNTTSSRGNGIRVGSSSGRIVTTIPPEATEEDHIQSPLNPPTSSSKLILSVGMVVPYKSFGTREYRKAVSNAESSLSRKLDLFKKYDLQVQTVMKELTPSPTEFFETEVQEESISANTDISEHSQPQPRLKGMKKIVGSNSQPAKKPSRQIYNKFCNK